MEQINGIENLDIEYKCNHDGLQWVLTKEFNAESKKDNAPTGEIVRRSALVGYFPKFDQAVSRMYEGMVADKVKIFNQNDIEFAVNAANTCREDVILLAREIMVNGPA